MQLKFIYQLENSKKAIQVAKGKAKLFNTSVFAILMNKVLAVMGEWETLSPSSKPAFMDSIISPHELSQLITLDDDPVVKSSRLNNFP